MARNTLINQLIRKISIAPFVLRYKGGQIIEVKAEKIIIIFKKNHIRIIREAELLERIR